MYEQLLTMTNIDPNPLPSKASHKRRANSIDEPPSKRHESDDLENLQSGMYTISPTYPTKLTVSNPQNFLQVFQDVFLPSFNSQMFSSNVPTLQPAVSFLQEPTTIPQYGAPLTETKINLPQCAGAIESDLDLLVDENTMPKGATLDTTEVFDETTGRLCLLNSSTKYEVTLGEIQRRLSHPETLHASLVNSILRKAKLKDGCRVLRNRLAEKGVTLPAGRRKTATTTTFTALCEKEAMLMARDFDYLCHNALNTCAIARRSGLQNYSPQELDSASRVLVGILDAFNDVPENPEDYVEKDSSTYTINILSLLTHGFGHNVIKTAIRLMMNIIEQQRAIVHGVPPTYNPATE
ncbi:Transcription factor AP-2 [Trichostrongylus colubriformis]|uniref:Transcription factor AP-2 n=1 Tax=Trichostrongylus colubriformis TaxID=6319 RepID=A0AAN8FNM0_TRICO